MISKEPCWLILGEIMEQQTITHHHVLRFLFFCHLCQKENNVKHIAIIEDVNM